LSTSGHDDFERGASDLYVVGLDPGFGFRQSDRSKPGQANAPALVPIELDSIQYVYVRKQASGTEGDDDAWRLARVTVLLYDAATLPLPRKRIFFLDAPKGMWFGNEHGHQAWLVESRVSGLGVRGVVDKLSAKAFQAAK